MKLAGREVVVLICLLLLAPDAWAQQASGIAGVVRDTSGGVLPGVTVEAASPALIERVRTVVTDGQGRYNIIDLRPGIYSVAFSLTGFSTLTRDGIVLTAGFTATVNADLSVGGLEESVTVAGVSPLVDVQNVRQQSVFSENVLNRLPTGHTSIAALTILIPGLVGNTDVGGLGAIQNTSGLGSSFHGKTGRKWAFDGMDIMNMQGSGNASFVLNQSMIEETALETGGAGADSQLSGISLNGIPKQGGNTFSGSIGGLFSNKPMQANNLDDQLRSRGLTTVNRLAYIYNVDGTVGGPIQKDRIWFYSGVKFVDVHSTVANIFYNLTPHSPFYTPDFSRPAERWESYQDYATRVTWQVSARNKIGVYADAQPRCDCRRPGNLAPEAQTVYDFWPQGVYQASWTMPATSRLLLEAGYSFAQSTYTDPPTAGVLPTDISILEQSTGLRYNAPIVLRTFTDSHRYAQRFSVSYVTGSHTFKAGFYNNQGVQDSEPYQTESLAYRFRKPTPDALPVPNQITQYASPYVTRNRLKADLGIYAQDVWTINRLTLNYGLRFEYFNAYVKPQHVDATRFLPARDFDAVRGVPLWKDLEPRLGVAYDLFGNGRTAVKVAFGKYMGRTGVDIAGANNPIETSVNSVDRAWNDINGDYSPDCDLTNFAQNGECDRITNSNFGKNNPNATRWADEVLRGWGVRDYLWDFSLELEQEINSGLSVSAGYYRNWNANNRVTDNLLWTPEDFDHYCITAPIDPRLPHGGGYQVCGLYDIKPDKFGLVQNLVRRVSDFGRKNGNLNTNDFVTFGFNARLRGGGHVGGGVDTGRRVSDSCYVVDSPQQLLNCRDVASWLASLQIKVNGSYVLPGDFLVSAVFQNIAGDQIVASYAAPTAEIRPSLRRNLAGGTRTATVPLIEPNTLYEPRRNQLDLRMGKRFRMGSSELQANLDLYNALNGNAIASRNNNWGGNWGQAISVLDARMLQISGSLTF